MRWESVLQKPKVDYMVYSPRILLYNWSGVPQGVLQPEATTLHLCQSSLTSPAFFGTPNGWLLTLTLSSLLSLAHI